MSISDFLVDMDVKEVIEFTGFELRKPAKHEINLVLNDIAYQLYHMEEKPEVSFDEYEAGIRKDKFDEINNCAYVMDFKHLQRRILVFSQLQLILMDDELYNKLSGADVSVGKHNHMNVMWNFVHIDKDDNTKMIYGFTKDFCLKKTS